MKSDVNQIKYKFKISGQKSKQTYRKNYNTIILSGTALICLFANYV